METFSEDTLRAAREKLLARGALLADRLKQVKADLAQQPDSSPMASPEAVTPHESAAVLLAIEKSSYAEIARIEAALEHMEDGTFGLCEECGHEIEAARFVAWPEAARCKACERKG